jgi:hypothetical protein
VREDGREPTHDDAGIVERLMRLPALHRAVPVLGAMQKFAGMDCLVGTFSAGVHLSIRGGEIVAIEPGPVRMKSWDFAFRATPGAWEEHWRAIPRAGFHDILALTKRGLATVEGDMQPFLANLQFFKDLVALPRADARGITGGVSA